MPKLFIITYLLLLLTVLHVIKHLYTQVQFRPAIQTSTSINQRNTLISTVFKRYTTSDIVATHSVLVCSMYVNVDFRTDSDNCLLVFPWQNVVNLFLFFCWICRLILHCVRLVCSPTHTKLDNLGKQQTLNQNRVHILVQVADKWTTISAR